MSIYLNLVWLYNRYGCILLNQCFAFDRMPGRPAKPLPKERLETMLKLNIPISKIAELLQMS
jgi:hypothetical protein